MMYQIHTSNCGKAAPHLTPEMTGRVMADYFTPAEWEQIVRIEGWATSLRNAGEDYTIFLAYNAQDRLVATKRIEGY